MFLISEAIRTEKSLFSVLEPPLEMSGVVKRTLPRTNKKCSQPKQNWKGKKYIDGVWNSDTE